jgi:hypothetical protein
MDFHSLLAKMQQIENSSADQPTQECGMMPPASPMSPPPGMPPKPEIPPPSMSVNINAQGLDNIEDMMKLFQKVNPDMMPKVEPMPTMAPPPSIMSIKPSMPPLKMLPDFDADNDDKVGGEMDVEIEPMDEPKSSVMKMDLDKDDDEGSQPGGLGASLDRDGDGDHDMDDHDLEPEDDEDKKEAWANEPNEEEKDIDYMVNKLAGGMNKSHETYPKVADGDNPMQKITRMGEDDLRAKIRAELKSRLAEAKDSKLEENPMDASNKPAAGVTASPKQAAKAAPPAAGATANVKSAAPAAAPVSTELNPIVKENLPQGLRQIADGIEGGNFKSIQDVMKEIKFLADELVKQSTGAK